MKVTKDIDIKMLKEMLGNMIERCQTSLKPRVELDYETAIRIYDVLEETQTREERHQTLESACTFMEMEDGTQTNEMELHNKTDANGNILRGAKEGNDDWNTTRKQMELHEKMTKMLEHLQRANGIIPVCFGNYEYDKNQDKCFKCEYIRKCAKSSDTVPDCYGCYEGSGKCTNCKEKTECLIDKQKRLSEEEDNEKSCFGNYRDCYMCTHCIDCEKCKEETIHREDVEEDDDFI